MFDVGQNYRRRDLHAEHGGQTQGGISTPKGRPYLLLFTGGGETYGYEDRWEHGVFLYSGEGQIGDMKFVAGNRAIRDHARNGKDLHLFRQKGGGRVEYLGCFACQSWHAEPAKDRLGKTRQAIIFHLSPAMSEYPGRDALAGEVTEAKPSTAPPSLRALREKALASASSAEPAAPSEAKRRFYERSEDVRRYVLVRAAGRCEACGAPAPFERTDGTPYLEPHHIRRLSDSGPDHPRWVGALCPNCHSEAHYGRHADAVNRNLREKVHAIEAGFDEEGD